MYKNVEIIVTKNDYIAFTLVLLRANILHKRNGYYRIVYIPLPEEEK